VVDAAVQILFTYSVLFKELLSVYSRNLYVIFSMD